MDRELAPRSAELEQVAEAHPAGTPYVAVGPDAVGTGVPPGGVTPTFTAASGSPLGLPEPTTLTWQDLLDLPGQILPPQTVYHLRNAGKEAALAAYSLWQNIRKQAAGTPENKVRKHIDVE
jgi:hypothetical protein